MRVEYWGLISYQEARARQSAMVSRRFVGKENSLIFCEHPPVITLGVRTEELVCVQAQLVARSRGWEVVRVDRGGGLSLHVPGMLMVYPVFKLSSGVRDFVKESLEQVSRAVGESGVSCQPKLSCPGLWTSDNKKLGSVGFRIRKGVSDYGIQLNVSCQLDGFSELNPCGVSGGQYTTMENVLGEKLALEEVAKRVAENFLRPASSSLSPVCLAPKVGATL